MKFSLFKRCLVAVLLTAVVPASTQTIQYSHACYGASTLSCTAHRVTCGSGSRVYPLTAAYGYKPPLRGCSTYFNGCPGDGSTCCQSQSDDCFIGYSQVDWTIVLANCWGAPNSCSSTAAWSRMGCTRNNYYYGIFSAFSVLSYLCVPGGATAEFHARATTTLRQSVVALTYTPSEEYGELEDSDDITARKCHVEAADCSSRPTEVYLALRLRSYSSGSCSSIGLSQSGLLPCSTSSSFQARVSVATPFDVHLVLVGNALPSTTGAVVMALDGSPLLVTCGYRSNQTPTPRCSAPTQRTVAPTTATTPLTTATTPLTSATTTARTVAPVTSVPTGITPAPRSVTPPGATPPPPNPETTTVDGSTLTTASGVIPPVRGRATTPAVVPGAVGGSTDNTGRSRFIGVVVGAVIVGLLLLLAFIVAFVACCKALNRKRESTEDSDAEDSITRIVRSSSLSQIKLHDIRGSGTSELSAELHNDSASPQHRPTSASGTAPGVISGYYSLDSLDKAPYTLPEDSASSGGAKKSLFPGGPPRHGLSVQMGSTADNPYFEPYDSRLSKKTGRRSQTTEREVPPPVAPSENAYSDLGELVIANKSALAKPWSSPMAQSNIYSEPMGVESTYSDLTSAENTYCEPGLGRGLESSPLVGAAASDVGYLEAGLRRVPQIRVDGPDRFLEDRGGAMTYENCSKGESTLGSKEARGSPLYTSMHCPVGMSLEELFSGSEPSTSGAREGVPGPRQEVPVGLTGVQGDPGNRHQAPGKKSSRRKEAAGNKPVPKKRGLGLGQIASRLLAFGTSGTSKTDSRGATRGQARGQAGGQEGQDHATYDHLGALQRPGVAKATEGDATYGHLGGDGGGVAPERRDQSGEGLYAYDRLHRPQRTDVIQDAIYSTPTAPPAEESNVDDVYANSGSR